MNHRHRRVLHALFGHPVSSNAEFKDVEAMLRELGAEIDNRSGNRVAATLEDKTAAFIHAQHGVPNEAIVQPRHFLADCGIGPNCYPV